MKCAETACLYNDDDDGIHDSKESSIEKPPNPTRTISSAGFDFSGEPLFAQHLILDFTPIAGQDNDCVSKKIISFWEFIHDTPEIQNLMVKPEKELSSSANLTETIYPESASEDHIKEKTAIEFLKFANEKGMLDGTRIPKSISHCTMGSQEYKFGELGTVQDKTAHVCTCPKTKSTCCTHPKKGASGLSKTIKNWDSKHPNKRVPPGHPPSLRHSIMQRQVHD